MNRKRERSRIRQVTIGAGAAVLFAISGCENLPTDPDILEGYTQLQLQANLAGTPATRLVGEVTGPDMPNSSGKSQIMQTLSSM